MKTETPKIVKSNFTPYNKQGEVIDRVVNNKSKYHVLVSSRQCGKTLMALNLLLYYAINYPGSYNVFVSPIFDQSKKSFTDLKRAAGDNALIKSFNSSELIMEFRNGSIIRMVSGESKANLRGFTCSGILILDEAAFMTKDLWEEVLMATTIIKGKKVLFISTPNGFNWFYDLYECGLSNEYPDWESHRIRSTDNPYLPIETINMAKLMLPTKAYLQEYEGEFVEGGGSVFEFGECANINTYSKGPEPGIKYYAGLDLAIANDFTVLIVYDDKGNIVDFFRENKTSWEQIISRVAEKINYWGCITQVEKNSIGSVVYEQLKKLCRDNLILSFVTTQESKQNIIEDLKLGFSKHSLSIPTKKLNPDMHLELSSFTYKMLPSGKIDYRGPSGIPDDIVMSMAIGFNCLLTKKSKGIYSVYSGR